MTETGKLSIIIVVFRTWEELSVCLRSFEASLEAIGDHEIIIVNNDPADAAAYDFAKAHTDLHLIHNGGNYGYAHGCNLGARMATGDILLFLNPDTEDPDSQLVKLLESKQRHPENAILSCRQINSSAQPQKVFGHFPSIFNVLGPMRAISRLLHPSAFPDSKHCRSAYREVDWVSGSVLMIDRAVFNELNGWCEDYWMYSEDVDLCYRARRLGHEVACTSSATIRHHHASASRQDLSIDAVTRSEVIISRHLYAHKHLGAVQRPVYHLLLFISRYLTLMPVALLGLIWRKAPYRVRLRARMCRHLTRYYKNLLTGMWRSPRANITDKSTLKKELH